MSNIPPGYSRDLLGSRHAFCTELESFISTEHEYVEGGLVISLDAPFGSGKTTTLSMWSDDLRQRRASNSDLPLSVWINAWESDYCGDPLVAIISGVTEALTEKPAPNPDADKAVQIRDAAKDVGLFALKLANDFVKGATGVDAIAAGKYAEEQKQKRLKDRETSPSVLDAYEARRDGLRRLKTALISAFGGESVKAIVFIDELDRCRPDYAISYLETIKHIFDLKGFVFVLAVDEQQLRSAATALFGPHLSFREYYRKFAHRTITLPRPSTEEGRKLARSYLERYIASTGKRISMMKFQRESADTFESLFACFELTIRQIQEIFRTVGHTLSKRNQSPQSVSWAFASGTFFMATLRIVKSDVYHQLGHNIFEAEALAELLKPIRQQTASFEYWFCVTIAGLRRKEGSADSIKRTLGEVGILDPNNLGLTNLDEFLRDYIQAWGHFLRTSGMENIYARIEKITTFAT